MLNRVVDLSIKTLAEAYVAGTYTPTQMVHDLYQKITDHGDANIWTSLIPKEQALAAAKALQAEHLPGSLPLYGIPFGVKDNIDVAGVNTSCSCEGYRRLLVETAEVVQSALDAGAILIGKNSLDQFATGLSGTRVLNGHCLNPFDHDVIPGGSSSGSGVAVASGLISFAIGTDTGGSGRIPAAMNNVVGIKPSLGSLSDHGVVHNSRFLDTPSVFAQTVADGRRVFEALIDPSQPFFQRQGGPVGSHLAKREIEPFVFATPMSEQLEFFGDEYSPTEYAKAIEVLISIGGIHQPIDCSWLDEASRIPFDTGLLAERHFNYGEIIDDCGDNVHPALVQTLKKAAAYTSNDVIQAVYSLKDLRRDVYKRLAGIDLLVTPTVAHSFKCSEIKASPVTNNHKVGHYTYFVSPLDLCAVAAPVSIKQDGVPFGISIIGFSGKDSFVMSVAQEFTSALNLPPGIDAKS